VLATPPSPMAAPPRPAPRPIVQALAPERYRVQFTIGQETQEKLRRLQLLRREIPDGDAGVIFDRAISLLLAKVEREKLGKAARPRSQRVIRPGTDSDAAEGVLSPRDPPNAVKRAVWARDGGRCAYVSRPGRRCEERTFLEFHHRLPHVKRGEATVDNIAALLAPQPVRGRPCVRRSRTRRAAPASALHWPFRCANTIDETDMGVAIEPPAPRRTTPPRRPLPLALPPAAA